MSESAKADLSGALVLVRIDDLRRIVAETVRAELSRADVPANNNMLTTAQAAEYCNLKPSALNKHVERGTLVPDAWGRRGRMNGHRFTRETLDAFMRRPSTKE